MKKLGIVLAMTAALVLVYVLMSALQPAVNEIVAVANSTANWTNFESTQNAINAWPLYYWGIPGFIYLVAITIYIKFGEG